MLEIRNLTAGYTDEPVLNEISASFEKGKVTSLIGLNGSGKSTLLRALLGILPRTAGDVNIDGVSIDSLSRTEIARRVAYLAQGKNTPDMTVMQMVLHGRFPHLSYPRSYGKADREIALAAIERVGLKNHVNTPLLHLSGGMRQNAYIAMALAQSTDYILLDEPTTYLDLPHQVDLMRLIRSLADSGKGIITVMHDLDMAFNFSDNIILLDCGRIVSSSAPTKICTDGIINKLFGASVHFSENEDRFILKYGK